MSERAAKAARLEIDLLVRLSHARGVRIVGDALELLHADGYDGPKRPRLIPLRSKAMRRAARQFMDKRR